MRAQEILHEWGRIVQGVNTTADVKPGEIQRQAAKFGNETTPEGVPVGNLWDSVKRLKKSA